MKNKYIFILLGAVFAAYFGISIYEVVFNNYLEEVHGISAGQRSVLELPRELPGILSLLLISILFFIREIHIAALAMLLLAIGIAALGIPVISSTFSGVIVWIMVASLGMHILMVVVDAIVLHTAIPENRSLRLGQMRGFITAAGLFGALAVTISWKYINKDFNIYFWGISGICLISGVLFSLIRSTHFPTHKSWRERFVLKKRYLKYYLLEMLFGARKQVFITFGIWVLVAVLGTETDEVATIMLIAGILGVFCKPMVGKLIQRFGERVVLVVDSFFLVTICMGYAFALLLFSKGVATMIIIACFIIDNLLFAVGTARASYLARTVEKEEDLTPSLYTGVAINHVVSISAALIGGYIWYKSGTHVWVFVFAAGMAVASGIVAATIRD